MTLGEQLVEVLKDINSNEAFFDEISKMLWKMYISLQTAGFNKEQAMGIVEATASNLKPRS